MKNTILCFTILAAAYVLVGCQGEERVSDDSKPGPAPQYKMIPAKSAQGEQK